MGLTIQVSIAPTLVPIQVEFMLAGLIAFIVVVLLGSKIFIPFAKVLYIGGLIFLLSPFVLGEATRGTFRWIDIGPFTLQPSELVKPLLAIGFARFFSTRKFERYSELLVGAALVFVPAVLIFAQPDLGSALVVSAGWLAIVAASGFPFKWFWRTVILSIAALPLFWKMLLKNYQRDRLISFLEPGKDPLGTGYNVIQAIVAVGSGEWYGRGLGRGTQSHLRFLPENHTDFVFASLSEELGLVGITVLLTAYGILLLRCLSIAQNAQTSFERLLVTGLSGMLFFQIIVNISMNLGLLPATGIPLPLVSYGGSSLVSTFVSLGLIYGIAARYKQKDTLQVK